MNPYPPDLDRRDLPHDPLYQYDRLGRKVPHRLTMASMILAIPGALERVRRVPAVAVVEENEAEALVKCPCGRQPVAPVDSWEKCPGCERAYQVLGGVVMVFYLEMDPPGTD